MSEAQGHHSLPDVSWYEILSYVFQLGVSKKKKTFRRIGGYTSVSNHSEGTAAAHGARTTHAVCVHRLAAMGIAYPTIGIAYRVPKAGAHG